MRGTPGYLAPEWLTSRISEKVDVYIFGVVIMQIITGRKNIDNSQPEENVQLINLLREKAQNNQFIDLIDNHGDDMVSHQGEMVQMMKLAIWCLQHESIRRPSMSIVIKDRCGPKQPEKETPPERHALPSLTSRRTPAPPHLPAAGACAGSAAAPPRDRHLPYHVFPPAYHGCPKPLVAPAATKSWPLQSSGCSGRRHL
ncbi:hypothetical protein ACQ4PT_000211 [Festuca glaucescens]